MIVVVALGIHLSGAAQRITIFDQVCIGTLREYWVDSTNSASNTFEWQKDGATIQNSSIDRLNILWDTPGVFTLTLQEINALGCGGEVQIAEITVTDNLSPTFVQLGPLCLNSAAPSLPVTSLEGVTGAWIPPTINTTALGTTSYVFTPNAGQCASVGVMNIVIIDNSIPTFQPIGPLCVGSLAPPLPAASIEGITGLWSPPAITTTTIGSFPYVFTPDVGQCAISSTIYIEITDNVIPVFTQIGPLCLNSTPPVLPSASLQGISGSWNPGLINTTSVGTFAYTFTPNPGQCAAAATMLITIADIILPTFNPIGPLCLNSIAPALPVTSIEGISGTWNPAFISTNATGTFSFVFTPDAGECAISSMLEVTITNLIVPSFIPFDPICVNTASPPLPLNSIEGIAGSWSPPFINTTITGISYYTFIPSPGQCADNAMLEILITDNTLPTFDVIGPLCEGSFPPPLPLASLEGITGNWVPSEINTTLTGATTNTFIPDVGQCSAITNISVEISAAVQPTFAAISPLCLNSLPPVLPPISNQGIAGTWNPPVITTTSAGSATYTFYPDAASVCSYPVDITIIVSGPEVMAPPVISDETNSQSNGAVELFITGSGLEYSYDGQISWGSSPQHSGYAAGNYSAWVRDANGCTLEVQFTIENRITGNIYLTADTRTFCFGDPLPLPAYVEGFAGVIAFDLQLSFDPLVLNYTGYNQVNQALLNGILDITKVDAGILLIHWEGPMPVNMPSGEKLLDLVMQPVIAGNTQLQWLEPVCTFYGADHYPIPTLYIPGSAHILPSPEVAITGGGNYCTGDTLVLQAISIDQQLLSYVWSGPGSSGFIGDAWNLTPVSLNQSGTYALVAQNIEGCIQQKQLQLVVNQKPDPVISDKDSLCSGVTHQLDAGSGFSSYFWHDGNVAQVYTTAEPGYYSVTVTNEAGCAGSARVWLVPCALELLFPTAFTPNGDGWNDIFRPVIGSEIQPALYSMMIFDKWGTLIFNSTDPAAGWDGTYKRQQAPTGIYSVVITFKAPPDVLSSIPSPLRTTVLLVR